MTAVAYTASDPLFCFGLSRGLETTGRGQTDSSAVTPLDLGYQCGAGGFASVAATSSVLVVSAGDSWLLLGLRLTTVVTVIYED